MKEYREEKRILDAAMDSNVQAKNDEFDVEAIYGELINLHINGQNIKEMFDAEFGSQKKMVEKCLNTNIFFVHLNYNIPTYSMTSPSAIILVQKGEKQHTTIIVRIANLFIKKIAYN